MRRYFDHAAKTRTLSISFILTVVFIAFVFPSLPLGAVMLDILPRYGYQETLKIMEAYGEDGRLVYLWASPTLDTVFPFIYVTFFAGILYRFRPAESLWGVAGIPVIAGFVDLAENIQIVMMLAEYPALTKAQVSSASITTEIKHALGMIYQGLTVLFLLIALFRFFGRKFAIGQRNSNKE